jgi:hypothetical protein
MKMERTFHIELGPTHPYARDFPKRFIDGRGTALRFEKLQKTDLLPNNSLQIA